MLTGIWLLYFQICSTLIEHFKILIIPETFHSEQKAHTKLTYGVTTRTFSLARGTIVHIARCPCCQVKNIVRSNFLSVPVDSKDLSLLSLFSLANGQTNFQYIVGVWECEYEYMSMSIWVWVNEYAYMSRSIWVGVYEYEYMSMCIWIWVYEYEYMNMSI